MNAEIHFRGLPQAFVGFGFLRLLLGAMCPCKAVGAAASGSVFSSGRGDLAPTSFGEGIGFSEMV